MQTVVKNDARRVARFNIVKMAAFTLASIVFGPEAWVHVQADEIANDVENLGQAKKIIADPPDVNYKMPVVLTHKAINPLNGVDAQTQIINKLFTAGGDYADAVDAFVSANEKLMGAEQAKDYYWIRAHAIESRQYALLAAQKLAVLNQAFIDSANFALQKLNGNDVILTRAQLANFQANLKAQGTAALPPQELQMLKNNLNGTDADAKNLVSDILQISPDSWDETPFSVKSSAGINANKDLINSFNDFSSNIGSNVRLGNVEVPVFISTPQIAHSIKINLNYDSSKYTYSGSSGLKMQIPSTVYRITEQPQGKLLIELVSKDGIPAGTAGTLLYLKFIQSSDVSQITSLGDDAAGWLYPGSSVPLPPPTIPQILIFKNGAWITVVGPTTPQPQPDVTNNKAAQWDGTTWRMVPMPTQVNVWTGSSWALGTAPTASQTQPATSAPVGQMYVWTGTSWVLADANLVNTALRPAQMSVYDVGMGQWVLTSLTLPK